MSEPTTYIKLDTPAGVVEVAVEVSQGVAEEVTFTNAPAFLFKKDIPVHIPGVGEIKVDLSFGGLYYSIVEAADLGVDLNAGNIKELIRLGNQIKNAVNKSVEVYHPDMDFINEATHVLFSAPSSHPDGTLKNAVVIPPGSVSRSPCGTGTCAKLAQLYARGELAANTDFAHESATTGTIFKSKVLEETSVGEFDAVITDVTGSAYVTGMHTFLIDPNDPLKHGFSFL